MSADEEIISPFYEVPTEILLKIFSYLPAKELIKCRQVCPRWMLIIDGMTEKEQLWVDFCRRDFNDCYYAARQKADISWYQLYRSLSLWPRLNEAVEEKDEFASAHINNEEIKDIKILKSGLVGVHKKNKIQYYDVNSWTISAQSPVTGHYIRYTENDRNILVHDYALRLCVIRKSADNSLQGDINTFHRVKMWHLNENKLFFVNLKDEICIFDTSGNDNNYKVSTENKGGVLSLGHSNGCLNILTKLREIYTLTNNREMKCVNINSKNILHTLYKLKFLDFDFDWRIYFQWMHALDLSVPEGPMQDIVILRQYGDMFFVGTNSGELIIFHQPFIGGELDIFRSEPLRSINFMKRAYIPILSTCPILEVDVLEVEDGHTVLVAMPKKVAILKCTHNF